jgi:hypothetical protein
MIDVYIKEGHLPKGVNKVFITLIKYGEKDNLEN